MRRTAALYGKKPWTSWQKAMDCCATRPGPPGGGPTPSPTRPVRASTSTIQRMGQGHTGLLQRYSHGIRIVVIKRLGWP